MKNQIRQITAALLLMAPLAANANLVTNGGFETGNLSGWTCTGADLCDTIPYIGVHSGSYAATGYDNSGFATLSQMLVTTAGTAYDFSFWSRDYEITPGNILRYQIGSGPIINVAQTTTFALTSDFFVADSANTLLQFFFETDPGTGTWAIDDVSVTARESVPEPASLALLGIGLAGLGAMRRKQRA